MHRMTECSMLKKLLTETYLEAHETSMMKPHRLTIFAEKLLYRCLLESQIPPDLGMILGRFLFPTSSPEQFLKKSSFLPSCYIEKIRWRRDCLISEVATGDVLWKRPAALLKIDSNTGCEYCEYCKSCEYCKYCEYFLWILWKILRTPFWNLGTAASIYLLVNLSLIVFEHYVKGTVMWIICITNVWSLQYK